MMYDLSKPLAPQIDLEMARLLWAKMGHTPNPAREQRIAEDARDVINQGFPADFAFGEAYSMEIALYGEPSIKHGFCGLIKCA